MVSSDHGRERTDVDRTNHEILARTGTYICTEYVVYQYVITVLPEVCHETWGSPSSNDSKNSLLISPRQVDIQGGEGVWGLQVMCSVVYKYTVVYTRRVVFISTPSWETCTFHVGREKQQVTRHEKVQKILSCCCFFLLFFFAKEGRNWANSGRWVLGTSSGNVT